MHQLFSEEEKIKRKTMIFTVLLLLQFSCGKVWARLATPQQAENVVTGWLKADARPLGTSIGRQVTKVETFTDDHGEPIYYIVYLHPSGFVIVPADDLVEPIIGFADDGIYNPSPENPLGALVRPDLNGRVTAVRTNHQPQAKIHSLTFTEAQNKWYRFLSLAESSKGSITVMGLPSLSDIRVAPLLQSKWSQYAVCDKNCYNYYTPLNYPCGCVATVMAQLMRYHQYPTTGIGLHEFTIKVDGNEQTAFTLGGDDYGGAYNWTDMALLPDCNTTETQRQAIGALCHDAGVSVNTAYRSDGSGADTLIAKDALTTIFKYENAIKGYNNSNNIGPALIGMVNPNLDYGAPIILGILREKGGHAALCDGYGYNASTLYHHLNMGWAGNDDAWYNLPNVEARYTYTSVMACVYNIFVSGTGEIISGLVTDIFGKPISGATVTAEGGGDPYNATTSANGIYALAKIPSATTYTVSATKPGYLFTDQTVTTGTSGDLSSTSGNRWEIDFVGIVAGDFDRDSDVDIADFAIFSSAWLTEPSDAQWNPDCDISSPADNFINMLDLTAFADSWLAGVE
ncbi:MAG: C10 family peptidase [Phycisphaerae bacterium]